MDAPIGAVVNFISPTGVALLEGYIVRKEEMQDMYADYDEYNSPEYGYSPTTIFYKIRVYDVVECIDEHKNTYYPPRICTVSENKVRQIIDSDGEFIPARRPPEVIDFD